MKRFPALITVFIVLAAGSGAFLFWRTKETREAAGNLPRLEREAAGMGLIVDKGSWDNLKTKEPEGDISERIRTVGAAIIARQPAGERRTNRFSDLATAHPELVSNAAALSKATRIPAGEAEAVAQIQTDLAQVTNLLIADAEVLAKARKFDLARDRYLQAMRLVELMFGQQRIESTAYVLRRRLAIGNSIMSLAATNDRDAEFLAFCLEMIRALPRVPEYPKLVAATVFESLQSARGLNTADLNYVDTQSDDVLSFFNGNEVEIPPGELGSNALESRVLEFWTATLSDLMGTKDSSGRIAKAAAAMDRLKKAEGSSWAAIKLQRPRVVELVREVESVRVWDATAELGLAMFEARRKSGKFPAQLPDSPLRQDPFANGPLKFSAIGSGFKIYSVGPDQQDGGGPEFKGLQTAGEDDDDLGYVHNPTQVGQPRSPVAIAVTKGRPPE